MIVLSIFKTNLLAFDNKNHLSGLYSLTVNEDIIQYATNTYYYHLETLLDEFACDNVDEYKLGEPFTVINPIAKEVTYIFPIHNFDAIKLLYKVNGNENYSGSLSIYFASELNQLLNNNSSIYILLTDGIFEQAFDGKNSETIYELYDSEEDSLELSNYYDENDYDLHVVNYEEMLTGICASLNISSRASVPTITEIDSKIVNVAGVSQPNHPWC